MSAWLRRALLLLALAGCGKTSSTNPNTQITPQNHTFFPIASGVHAADCSVCHQSYSSFQQFTCFGCHAHDEVVTDPLHTGAAAICAADAGAFNGCPTGAYVYSSPGCYGCHPSPNPNPTFDHTGITAACATCHDVGQQWAALPVAGFTHPDMNGADCGACHNTTSWLNAAGPGGLRWDVLQDVNVAALIPTYSATSIAALSPLPETFHMAMDHSTTEVVAAGMAVCANCHLDSATGVYYPGNLHSSLANLQLPQPTSCTDCHAMARPTGFVGPAATNPPRTPSSGEMKHDAVAWSNDAPTATALVPADCGLCHASPDVTTLATWASNKSGTTPALFHPALTAASLAQPGSCVDCHANSRPETTVNVPDAGITFDHTAPAALDDCATCHAASAASQWVSWTGGKYHLPGSATPSSCLPCHAGERPTSTASWTSATYTTSPFDYVPNSLGIGHGDGQDCVTCHAGPGTGAWGAGQNWVGGHFAHGPSTVAGTTCFACHTTERPDLRAGTTTAATGGFDHSVNGTGDCSGCHQATVDAGTYVVYPQPLTTEYSSDWRYGQSYPGSNLIGSGMNCAAPPCFINVTELDLTRSGTNNLVTGMNSVPTTLFNEMLHTSSQIPVAMSPGPANNPDMTKCAYCHAATGYSGGIFHPALTDAGFPQPTAGCTDCHNQMRPTGIVEKASSELQPMDHSALFTAAVTIGGQSVTGVGQVDCSDCHKSPGSAWNDGVFHSNIAGATPKDCTVCHYPLMADKTSSDLSSGVNYAMKHASTQLTFQNCQTCHTTSLANVATLASTAWTGAKIHPNDSPEPLGCIDCHSISEPASNASTQSSWTYVLTLGSTSTNGGQWMNHGSSFVVGQDCVTCHAMDDKASGSAWSKSDYFHSNVANPTTCTACHGLTNGLGGVDGTDNNLPNGLSNSSTVTTAVSAPDAGIAPNTDDQIDHSDVDVTTRNCNSCHTQVGISTVNGIAGHEWAQAKFHANVASVGGRCSNCHMNVKPGPGFAAQDHSMFTDVAGTQDCSSCHSWPGACGTTSAPNWLCATGGVPQTIIVGNFTVPSPPYSASLTVGDGGVYTPPQPETGIASLPHPDAGAGCTSCHTGGVGGTGAIGYDHSSTLINANCNACHEAGSPFVSPVWTGATTEVINSATAPGDTRPFTLASVGAREGPCGGTGGCSTERTPLHFYPIDCHECHSAPKGLASGTSGSAYLGNVTQTCTHSDGGTYSCTQATGAWVFNHQTRNMTNPQTCYATCHENGPPH